MLQQQLDDSNAKLLAQFKVRNAEILKLEEQSQTFYRGLVKSLRLYREQAMKAGGVPSPRRIPTSAVLLAPSANAVITAQISCAFLSVCVPIVTAPTLSQVGRGWGYCVKIQDPCSGTHGVIGSILDDPEAMLLSWHLSVIGPAPPSRIRHTA